MGGSRKTGGIIYRYTELRRESIVNSRKKSRNAVSARKAAALAAGPCSRRDPARERRGLPLNIIQILTVVCSLPPARAGALWRRSRSPLLHSAFMHSNLYEPTADAPCSEDCHAHHVSTLVRPKVSHQRRERRPDRDPPRMLDQTGYSGDHGAAPPAPTPPRLPVDGRPTPTPCRRRRSPRFAAARPTRRPPAT